MLDPQVKKVVDLQNEMPPVDTLSPEEMRQIMKRLRGEPTVKTEVFKIEEKLIPSYEGKIRLRIYTPNDSESLPALVYFHGGGWVTGDLDSVDHTCREIANRVPCVVISVDYRLAPEYKFPTAVKDAYEAVKWVVEHSTKIKVDPNRVAVGGDSAGATLATVVTHMARDLDSFSLAYQVLVYPVTDFSFNTPSYQKFGEGYFLTTARMKWFTKHYLRNKEDRYDPKAAPLHAKSFRDLPPALIITAECDPLTDEGEAYAKKLKEEGVPVRYSKYDGMIHGFFIMSHTIDKGKEAIMEVATTLKDVFYEDMIS